jgi:hypothetical protein
MWHIDSVVQCQRICQREGAHRVLELDAPGVAAVIVDTEDVALAVRKFNVLNHVVHLEQKGTMATPLVFESLECACQAGLGGSRERTPPLVGVILAPSSLMKKLSASFASSGFTSVAVPAVAASILVLRALARDRGASTVPRTAAALLTAPLRSDGMVR